MSKLNDEIENDKKILDSFSRVVYYDTDLFSNSESLKEKLDEFIEFYKWKKKLKRANRMKSKKKRKRYKKYLYGLRGIQFYVRR